MRAFFVASLLAGSLLNSGSSEAVPADAEGAPTEDRARLAPPQEARIRYRLATALMEEAEYNAALAHLEQVIVLTPTWGLAQLTYARCRLAIGAPDGPTIKALQAAARLTPKNPRAHHELGRLLETQDRLDEANRAYLAVVRLQPRSAHAHLRLGALALRQDNLTEARSRLQIAAGLDPSDIVAHTLLAETLERAGLPKEAERELRNVIGIRSENSYSWRRLAAFYQRQGKEDQAAKALAEAARLEARKSGPRRRMRPLQPSAR